MMNYSVLNATTGSLRDALLEGIRPESMVRKVDTAIRINAPSQGRIAAMVGMPVRC